MEEGDQETEEVGEGEKVTAHQMWFLQPISVPLRKGAMDPRSIQAAASAIVSRQPRSFEVF